MVINLLSQGGDHVNVDLDTGLVVILHAALLISDAVEVLLEGKKLVLEELVLSFPSSEVHGLSSKLSDKSILVVLGDCGSV